MCEHIERWNPFFGGESSAEHVTSPGEKVRLIKCLKMIQDARDLCGLGASADLLSPRRRRASLYVSIQHAKGKKECAKETGICFMYEHPFYTCSYMYPAHVFVIGPTPGRERIERFICNRLASEDVEAG